MAGRAALYDMLKKRQQEKEQREKAQRESMLQQETASKAGPSIGSGRASLLEKLKQSQAMSSQIAQSSQTSTSSGSPATSLGRGSVSVGRASLFKKISEQQQRPGFEVSVDPSGVTGNLAELSIEETSSGPISRQGESGKPINITSNYINILFEEGTSIQQYLVKFDPEIDSRPLRRHLLNQHSSLFGSAKAFDGSLLHLAKRLPEEVTKVYSVHPNDNSQVELTIIYKKQQRMSENVSFFNVLFNRVLRSLDLVHIGRQDYDPTSGHKFEQHKLELWPGFVTAINEFEGGVKLCIDATHRVLRTDTVRDLMNYLYTTDQRNFQTAAISEIVGMSVITRYNNRTYRIDDIDWKQNPESTFEKKGQQITLIDYYRTHYGITIMDTKQPLLIHRETKKLTTGEKQENIVLLVPELCYVSGLTEKIRSDFRVMKDIAQVTQVGPKPRIQTIIKFIRNVNQNEVARKILSDWGMRLEEDTVRLQGRVLPPEVIIFGNGKTFQDSSNNANWNNAAVRSAVLRTPNLNRWCIIFSRRDERSSREFVEMLLAVTRSMCIDVKNPIFLQLKDDRTETYVNQTRKVIKENEHLEMLVFVFPTNRNDRYAAIKKLCCVDMPISSQVIIGKTISRADKLKSVTEKIALQINCKLGGALWALKIPFDNCMVCGVDVYHSGVGQGKRCSVAGFVASLDKNLTKWHSKICIQGPHQELIDLLKTCLMASIKVYHSEQGRFPDRIFLYRDGVGDGQIDTIKKYEVAQLLQIFPFIDENYAPKLSVIIVQKRINTRLIAEMNRDFVNPPPGTIVDSVVTRRNYYDFFLVPQSARQGTVTPTHYIVVHDGAGMKTDHMQRLTYKLCHLYYNMTGTIRVPAPCQYAHKLAYLVGQSLQTQPHPHLANRLYYL